MLHITLDNASVTREGRTLLDKASLTLEPGCHLAVLGRNGAGKTTLLKVLRGDMPPDDATSRRYESSVTGVQADPLGLRHRIGLVSGDMQDFYEGSGWKATGREIVLAGFYDSPLLYEKPTGEMQRKAQRALDLMDASAFAELRAGELSTGQLRRILMARALANEPEVLLLDECFDGLDEASRSTALALLRRISVRCTLVVTAHREEDIPSFIGTTVHLSRGEIREDADTEISPEQSFCLLDNNAPDMSFILKIRNTDVMCNGKMILHDIDFDMFPGEIWAISGRNGAGKSTFLKLILGDVSPYADEGTVERFGGEGTGEAHRRRMAVVSPEMHGMFAQEPHCRDTVLETVLSGLYGTIGLYDTPSDEDRKRGEGVLAFVGMTDLAERRMESLSHGQRRRALLARAVAGKPWLLLLDEPMSGLDAHSREQMGKALEQLVAGGVPMLIVSHREKDLPQGVTGRLVLENGRIVSSSPVA